MKIKLLQSARFRNTTAALLVGALFTAAAILVVRFFTARIEVQWAITAAFAVIIALAGFFTGRKADKLQKNYKRLEQEASERSNAIMGLMDVSGLGILSFNNKLKVNPEYSRECEKIFMGPITGEDIDQLLFINPSIREEFKEGMELFFSGKSKFEVIFDLTEKETVINSQFFKMDFREINQENVLCVLTNITSEHRLEEKIQHEIEERKILLRAVSHKNYFGSFIKEAALVFDRINLLETKREKTRADLEELQRELHTFKGNAGFFGFSNTEEVAYDFEYYIADMLTLEEGIEFDEITQDLKKAYFNELQVIKKILGPQWLEETDSVLVPRDEYLAIENHIKAKLRDDVEFCHLVERFRKVPMNHLFARFPAMAERLAANLGKKVNPLTITGGDFLVLPEKYEPLANSFVHIMRNMVDHGIETPTDREIQQKSKAGNIKIDIQSLPEGISIRFSDDGQGISPATLKQKAIELGLMDENSQPTEDELLKLLFKQSFSTAANVSHISGWGVGLAAVREVVNQYQGRIKLKTKLNVGTSFEIILPANN